MPSLALTFPVIDPVAVSIGPFAVRWYALAYVAGLLIGWWLARHIAGRDRLWGGEPHPAPLDIDDLIVWIALGVVLGGRVGYVLFYNFDAYLADPVEALKIWQGGMSFHGGFIGTLAAMWIFARVRRLPVLGLFDVAAAVTPIGLFFGRIANFVNGELWGRVTDVPWGVVFPRAGAEPRHPSQLYEAALEGVLLFAVINAAVRLGALKRPGLASGIFGLGYGIARILVEMVREPDVQVGFLAGGLTMGMALSAPMAIVGLLLIIAASRRETA